MEDIIPVEASVFEEGDQSTDHTCPVCPVNVAFSTNLTISYRYKTVELQNYNKMNYFIK